MRGKPILQTDLSVSYGGKKKVLDRFAIEIEPGEIVGLAGESGSGKSTLALALLKVLNPKRAQITGSVWFQGRDLLALSEREMRALRGNRISLIFQSAGTALNPLLRIGSHFREAWRAHAHTGAGWADAARPLLNRVCLPSDDEFLRRFPRQISVGQAQRVLIALALLHAPDLIVADEPTSALDAITHAEILQLFRELNRELGTAMLFISHDLLSVSSVCSKLAVLHQGKIVEAGTPQAVFASPQHNYTRRLLAALPAHPLGEPTMTPSQALLWDKSTAIATLV